MQMDKKQTLLLFLIVLAFGFLGYQVIALVRDDVSQTPSSLNMHQARFASRRPVKSSLPTHRVQPTHIILAQNKPSVFVQHAMPTQTMTLKHSPMPSPSHHLTLGKSQQRYIHLVSQYELAKMKRRLLDEQAAIADAQHRIALLNKKTRELSVNGLNATTNPMNEASADNGTFKYRLGYIDKQNGQWSATLTRNGQYQEVSVGSHLANGLTVEAISQQGVILDNQLHRLKLTFNGVSELPKIKKIPIIAKLTPPKPKIHYAWKPEPVFKLALAKDPAENNPTPAATKNEE